MSESPYIVNVTNENFAAEVIERSKQVPVLVDFWAEWCAPCKMLLPVLTKLAEDYQGQFILAKVNTDQQQALASEYQIRSIPTLKLFRYGTVVEEIMGAQSEAVLRDMIDRHRERPADKIRLEATKAEITGNYDAAIRLLNEAKELDPSYTATTLDLARVLLHAKRLDEAEQVLKTLPANKQTDLEVGQLHIQLKFAQVVEQAPSKAELEQLVEKNPEDNLARYQLSAYQVRSEEYESAMVNLLEIMKRDRKFEDDAGRKGLLDVFNLLGNQGRLVVNYRSKMSSLLY